MVCLPSIKNPPCYFEFQAEYRQIKPQISKWCCISAVLSRFFGTVGSAKGEFEDTSKQLGSVESGNGETARREMPWKECLGEGKEGRNLREPPNMPGDGDAGISACDVVRNPVEVYRFPFPSFINLCLVSSSRPLFDYCRNSNISYSDTHPCSMT